MFELILIPSILGLALAWDYFASLDDDSEDKDPPIEITLGDGVTDFFGTDAREHVTGNALDNLMVGGGDDDLMGGLGGDDTLEGGEGDDRLFGGEGMDQASGGPGNDRLFLGDDDDHSVPEPDSQDDEGDDLVRGGAGNDLIHDSKGSNELFGDLGHDLILSVDGLNADGTLDPEAQDPTPDTVHAGFGNDTLVGDAGDHLTGGQGRDSFVVATASDATGAPAMLMDFDLSEDLFSVVFLDTPEVEPTIEFSHDAETDQLRAIVNGRTVAVLNDITEADIPFIQTFVTSLPELLAREG